MKMVGRRPNGWWKIAKLARGDYCVADLYELEYKRSVIRGKVYVIDSFPAERVSESYFVIDQVRDYLMRAVSASRSVVEVRELTPVPRVSNVVEHEYEGGILGFTARNDDLGIEATAPVFDSLKRIDLAYKLLRLAGFKVQKPEAIWRSIIANIPPWIRLMSDKQYSMMLSDLKYHYEQAMKLAAEIGRYEAMALRHRTRDIEVQVDMIRDEPLVDGVELKPFKLIIYTKPITVRDEKTGYEWTNSYEIEFDMTMIDKKSRDAIKVRGEKVVDDLYHPHIKTDYICASAITDAMRELASGRIYNAAMIVLNILQSYDPEHNPFATIEHMVERLKQLEEAVE